MKRLVLPGVTLNRVRRPRNLHAIANIKTQKTTGTPVDEKVVEESITDTIVDKELTSETTVDEKVVEEPKKTRNKKKE